MEMTENEILKSYRSAKIKEKQIQVLAELNSTERLDIIKILAKNGEQVRVSLHKRGKNRNTELEESKYRSMALKRLEHLEQKIRELEEEYREIAEAMKTWR